MENLIIKASKYTPEITLNADDGVLNFSGKSYPENTFDFYLPIINWIEMYLSLDKYSSTKVNMDIIYFNSSSSKLFFDLFDLFEEKHNSDHKIDITWFYDEDNENAYEAGEDFQEDFENLSINLVKK